MPKGGFTLIELLVVISVIGITSTIVFTSLSEVRARARDAVNIQQVRVVQKALEIYKTIHGSVPPIAWVRGK